MILVPNGPLREAYQKALERGVVQAEICRALGWVDRSGRMEAVRLTRMLGISPDMDIRTRNENGGQPRMRKHIEVKNAAKIAREIGADPIDVGL